MNKEQAIKLFEGLIEDTERAKKSWGTGDTGYYTSEALISAYNLAISVVKVMDAEDEPKQDKPVVKQFVADWYESQEEINDAIIDLVASSYGLAPVEGLNDFETWFYNSDDAIETLIKMKLFGYTVKPKRWVVRQGGSEVWYLQGFRNSLDGDVVRQWCSHEGCIKFTDKSKAEAVATLVEGSVEEI